MAHSYVSFRGEDALLNDGLIMPFMVLFMEALENRQKSEPFSVRLSDMCAYWRRHVLGEYIPGCMSLQLDDFLTSERDIKDFLSLLGSARGREEQMGADFDGAVITRLVDDAGLSWGTSPTRVHLEVIETIARLVGTGLGRPNPPGNSK